MVWAEDHKVLFCQETRLRDLYQYKDGSRERGQCLSRIAESLNAVPRLWFNPLQPGVAYLYPLKTSETL